MPVRSVWGGHHGPVGDRGDNSMTARPGRAGKATLKALYPDDSFPRASSMGKVDSCCARLHFLYVELFVFDTLNDIVKPRHVAAQLLPSELNRFLL